MHYVILKFPRSNVASIIDALNINSTLDECDSIEEYSIVDFFSAKLYDVLKKISPLFDSKDITIIGFNYPIERTIDVESLQIFFRDARDSNSNLFYFPKPNQYVEINDFALFSLKEKPTIDNYAIEMSYVSGTLDRYLRNKLHIMLRESMGIDKAIINKKVFYESRKLFNLSYSWKEYTMSLDSKKYDLLERVELFYPAPPTINIGITNQCNLKCTMCPYHSLSYKTKHITDFFDTKVLLDKAQVYKTIDYAIDKKCYSIDFTSPGESLLDSRLFEFVEYARAKSNIKIGLVSNAVLLNEEIGRKLLDAGVNNFVFSVDGATSETYEKIRGTKLQKVEDNIKNFIDYSKSYNDIEISLNCVLLENAEKEKEEYIKKWKKYDGRLKLNFQGLLEYCESGVSLKGCSWEVKDRFSCARPWNCQLGVMPNGDITICCTIGGLVGWKQYELGNIYKAELDDIWNKSLYKIRKACLDMDFSEFECCAKCSEWSWDIYSVVNDEVSSVFREFK